MRSISIKTLLSVCCLLTITAAYGQNLREASKGVLQMGVAVNTHQVDNPESVESQTIAKQFECIVAENCMKMAYIHPSEGTYFWDEADKFVEFGIKNNQKVIGHTLIWHSQAADWFTKDKNGKDVSPKVLKKRMKEYITTVVKRYKGKIYGWDVVNEAFEDNGSYRDSPYYRILGEEYIKLAFRYAHEADPEAELYYNDYSMSLRPKCNAVARMVNELKEEGCRIDAVGFQGHMDIAFPIVSDLEKCIQKMITTGVKVNVTEWDVSILPSPYSGADISTNFKYNTENDPYKNGVPEEKQKEWNDRIMSVFRLFLKYKDNIDRITFWGLTDGQSWRNDFPIEGRTDYALFFDRESRPKAVVYQMTEELLNNK